MNARVFMATHSANVSQHNIAITAKAVCRHGTEKEGKKTQQNTLRSIFFLIFFFFESNEVNPTDYATELCSWVGLELTTF